MPATRSCWKQFFKYISENLSIATDHNLKLAAHAEVWEGSAKWHVSDAGKGGPPFSF